MIEVSFKPKYFTAKKLVPLILAVVVIVIIVAMLAGAIIAAFSFG